MTRVRGREVAQGDDATSYIMLKKRKSGAGLQGIQWIHMGKVELKVPLGH